jgi:putative ABC transport system permease protein
LAGIQLSAGRFYTPEATHEMMVGKSAASSPQLAVGQTVELDGQDFQIVGIYETGNVLLDGGALFPLKRLQELKRRIDQLTTIFVKAKPHTDINQLTQRIEQTYKNELITMRDLGDYNRSYQGTMLVRVGTWLISLLALVIGGIGVMNTMIMAVFERTREIGILRAVGWRRRRVLQMILGESLILGACAGVIGTLMGLGAIRLVTLLPNVRGFIGPSYTPTLFGEALLIALIVGLLGGLYPAFRATRILPQEALRYE